MNIPAQVSLSHASLLLHRNYKTIRRACIMLGIPLVRDSANRFMLSATDLPRIDEYITAQTTVVDSQGCQQPRKPHSDEESLSDADLRVRIAAARRFKERSCGRFLTDERLEAELQAMRRGVAS